jgi:hypothetical protein
MPALHEGQLHHRFNCSAAPLASCGEVATGGRDVTVTGEISNGLDVGEEEARAECVPEAVKRTVLGCHAGTLEEFPGPPRSLTQDSSSGKYGVHGE